MSMSLFDTSKIIKLPLQDATIEYHPQFFSLEEANALFDDCIKIRHGLKKTSEFMEKFISNRV